VQTMARPACSPTTTTRSGRSVPRIELDD
jgi:hypothetical protein